MNRGLMLAGLVFMMMAAHTLGQDLTVSVVPSSTSFDDKQDVEVILNYENKGTKKILVYKWYLPEQELFDPLFDVFRNGKRVEYVGPVVKRRPPVAADMISLEPGQSKSARVQLSAAYNMTVTGTYSVRFNASLGSMSSTSSRLLNTADSSQLSDATSDSRLVSSAVTISTAGSPNAVITESTRVSPQVRATTYTYTGCSTTQKNAIVAAIKAAKTYSSGTLKYLSTVGSSGTTRYTTWFGKYSLNNLVTLRTHFTRITDLFNTKSISFNCTCKMANTYAYVYPTITYKIYLCPVFWSSPTTGTDTKGGTLVHEGSHFTVVADTDDHAYGQASCKNLAKNNPTKALNNADSHQYFTENNPSLK